MENSPDSKAQFRLDVSVCAEAIKSQSYEPVTYRQGFHRECRVTSQPRKRWASDC